MFNSNGFERTSLGRTGKPVRLTLLHYLNVIMFSLDGTNVFLSDRARSLDAPDNGGLSKCSLSNVTVLIGMFNKRTGKPLLGVVGKPFSDSGTEDPV